jgi:6-phosphogluconate dehydrogenase
MQLGMIGLDRTGANMVTRLTQGGHQCVVFDPKRAPELAATNKSVTVATQLQDFVNKLSKPRAVWIMPPAGDPTEKTVDALASFMEPGDTIIDGGNAYSKDDVRRAKKLAEKNIHYLNAGTSGGVCGVECGCCRMVGGEPEVFMRLEPIFATLAPGTGSIDRSKGRTGEPARAEKGYIHAGPNGAGHFVKMVHNGIEYASEIASRSRSHEETLPRRQISAISPRLRSYRCSGGSSLLLAFLNILKLLYTRFRSRQDHTFGEKVLSSMRRQFGGHVERLSGG